jgi:hypothetical protein
MAEWEDWSWLVQTDKGKFFITVVCNWGQSEAADVARSLFERLGLSITGMIQRKRVPAGVDNAGTIIQQSVPRNDLGYDFTAGKAYWDACGRGDEYESQARALRKEIEKGEL